MRITRRNTTAIATCVYVGIYQSGHREAYVVIVFVAVLSVALSFAGKPNYPISLNLYDLILRYIMTVK